MQGKKVTDYLLLSIPLDMLEEAGISAESVIQMSAVSGKILIKGDGSRTHAALRGLFSALFPLSSSPCDSKASSSAGKIIQKLLPAKCCAVSGEVVFVQASKRPQGILAMYFQGLL